MLSSAPRGLEDFEVPRLVGLSKNLSAACFFLMKFTPARAILDQAEAEGHLEAGGRIAETSSGSFALALAMLARSRGYRLTIVSDPAIDDRLQLRLRHLGTELYIITNPDPVAGFQKVRLAKLREILESDPQAFWPNQYDNPYNGLAYGRFAEYLVSRLGRIDCIVGTVGSGGSMTGTARVLRAVYPDMKAVAVDTHGSVLFGETPKLRILRGMGHSLMPQNLDHKAFDQVHWVEGLDAVAAARRLHSQHALYMGATSGAAFLVAEWYARMHPEQKVVVLFPDEGHRYQDEIYNLEWLGRQVGWPPPNQIEPMGVSVIGEHTNRWTYMDWRRRSLSEVASASEPLPA